MCTGDLFPKLMIVSNLVLVLHEKRPSGASRHQLEARKKILVLSTLDASSNDKVQFHVSLLVEGAHISKARCGPPGGD